MFKRKIHFFPEKKGTTPSQTPPIVGREDPSLPHLLRGLRQILDFIYCSPHILELATPTVINQNSKGDGTKIPTLLSSVWTVVPILTGFRGEAEARSGAEADGERVRTDGGIKSRDERVVVEVNHLLDVIRIHDDNETQRTAA